MQPLYVTETVTRKYLEEGLWLEQLPVLNPAWQQGVTVTFSRHPLFP